MDDPPLLGAAPEPGSYDYPDPDAERQRQAETSLREQRLKEVEASILSTPTGREWLWGVLRDLHVFEKRFALTGAETENRFFDGQREAGLMLMQRFLSHDSKHFAMMFQENQPR